MPTTKNHTGQAKRNRKRGANAPDELVLTREELAAVLRVSVRTVDRMVTAEDIPVMDLGDDLVRFYLPDVLEALRSGKRKFGRNVVTGGPRPEVGGRKADSAAQNAENAENAERKAQGGKR